MVREIAICLVHGLGFPNRFMGIRHWGSLKRHLEMEGFKVNEIQSEAFAPLSVNVKAIRDQFKEIARKHEIIVIAHSKGCLESILAYNDEVLAERIDRMILFNPTIHGLEGAKRVLGRFPEKKCFIYRLMNLLGTLMGDREADSFTSFTELKKNWIPQIEGIVKNGGIELVFVYAANEYRSLPLFYRISSRYLYAKDHKGDGEVEISDELLNSPMRKMDISRNGEVWTHDSITGLPFVSKPVVKRMELIRELIR